MRYDKRNFKKLNNSKNHNSGLIFFFVVAGLAFSMLISISVADAVQLKKDKELNDPELNMAIEKRIRREISAFEYQNVRERALKRQKNR